MPTSSSPTEQMTIVLTVEVERSSYPPSLTAEEIRADVPRTIAQAVEGSTGMRVLAAQHK